MNKKIIVFSVLAWSAACNNDAEKNTVDNTPPILNYSVVKALPHDTTSFTEGFLFHNGQLYESTGHTDNYPSSRSLFGSVDLSSGKIQTKAEIDKNKYFG